MNRVPSCAQATWPRRSALASVKAPRTWPNISDSNSDGVIAPMLILTAGRAARGLLRWMASATSSLPVPLSPRISTGALVAATWPMVASTRSSLGCSPMMAAKSYWASSEARVTRAGAGAASCKVAPTSWASCRLSHGLVKKLAAPACTPFTASAIEPHAVINSTGRPGWRSLMAASRARPSSPLVCSEKFMSCRTRSNGSAASSASAWAASSQQRASKPDCLSSRASETWTAWSSSTTRMRGVRVMSFIVVAFFLVRYS